MKEHGLYLYLPLIISVQKENNRLIKLLGCMDIEPEAWVDFAYEAMETLKDHINQYTGGGNCVKIEPQVVYDSALTAIAILMKIAEMFLIQDLNNRVRTEGK